MNEQSVAFLFQLLMRADKRFSGGPLQESARLGVKDAAEKVVGRRVTNLQLDRWIKTVEFNQLRLAKLSGLFRRLGCERLFEQFADRSERLDAKLTRRLPPAQRCGV